MMRRNTWTHKFLALWSALMMALLLGGGAAQAQQSNPQPAILGTAGSSDQAVVFPDPGASPATQKLVPSLSTNTVPHGVAYYGSDNALISDFGSSRVFVVKISTAELLATIDTSTGGYNGTGTIAVAPDRNTALANGSSDTLSVIRGPFQAGSTISQVALPGAIAAYQTQGIVFNNAGRAFVYTNAGISVLDAPYNAVAFTIPVDNSNGGAIAITPDGNTLLTTEYDGQSVHIVKAPFFAASTSTTLTIPNGDGLDGIKVTPDGSKAIVVSGYDYHAAAISAPFSSNSNVQDLPLPQNGTGGFEDVDISPDGKIALLTGGTTDSTDLLVRIRAPFTTAGATSQAIPIQNVDNPGRGAGAVRFQPAGLAPGLTISKSAPQTVASGANLTYTISYANTGTVAATGVVIRDPLPTGTTFVSATNGGTFIGGNGVPSVVFNVGNLPANSGNRSVSFTVKVTAAQGATVNNNNYTIEASDVAPIAGPPVSTTVTQGGGGNRPPVANNQSVTTPQNTPINITLTATDPDVNALTYGIVQQPTRGTLTVVNANTVRYTPAAGYSGADSFTFQAGDGQALSNVATVSINVTAAAAANRVVGQGTIIVAGRRYNFNIDVTGDANGNASGSAIATDGRNDIVRSTRITGLSVSGTTATITGIAVRNRKSYTFTLLVSDTRFRNGGTFNVRSSGGNANSRVSSGYLYVEQQQQQY